MALTPEDVVNKRFQPTKFREGYDQDEVDDFLDEVVVELRRLGQENEELRQRQIGSDSRISELQRSGASTANAPVSAPVAIVPAVEAPPAPTPEPVRPPEAESTAVAPQPVAPSVDEETSSTTNLLTLARRLHEEHVREGVEKRDSLIAEGQATAARVLSDADEKQRIQLAQLDRDRTVLERRIDELRSFEHDYRQKLKSYIEGQLSDLNASTSEADSAQPVGSDAGRYQGVGGN